MRKNLPLVIVAFFVAATLCIAQTGASSKSKNAGGSNLEQMIIDKARESWEAYKNRDVAAIKALDRRGIWPTRGKAPQLFNKTLTTR